MKFNKSFIPDDNDGIDDFTEHLKVPGWEIDADLDPELKSQGLDFLSKGIKPRKVAIHLGITIDKIKKVD